MKLHGFYIKNFKSIVDSGWCILSPDNITTFIGQNEAGKSAILEAISAFDKDQIPRSAIRSDGGAPEIVLSYKTSREELEEVFPATLFPHEIAALEAAKWVIAVFKKWDPYNPQNKGGYALYDSDLKSAFDNSKPEPESQEPETADGPDATQQPEKKREAPENRLGFESRSGKFAEVVLSYAPYLIEFNEESGLLPNSIDIDEIGKEDSKAQGVAAARNFLSVAEIDDIADLVKGDVRVVDTRLERASAVDVHPELTHFEG